MQNEQSQLIVNRFFTAIQQLIDDKVIRGKQTFTRRYGINRWNFLTCAAEPHRDIFQVAWLGYLVTDYGVSADWLLTGKGTFYRKKQKTCNSPATTENSQPKAADTQRIVSES